MAKLRTLLIAASVAALMASAAVSAQEEGDATLRVDTGTVMTSDGGEFATARTGKVLDGGDRLMVTEGAVATVFYDNGCTREYDVPGVYVVDAECVPVAAIAGKGATNWTAASAVLSGVGLGAALLHKRPGRPGPPDCLNPPGPPSPPPGPPGCPPPVSR